jgi:hypothetical protein
MTVALCALTFVPSLIRAQGEIVDRLTMHGSLNQGYGKAFREPTLGLPLNGTSDYRTFTFQTRFKLDDENQIVSQIFNRRFGTSPLASSINDLTLQWAYWQHKKGNVTLKFGRNPFSRGLVNEVRYIGSVNPFFRPPIELQSDAFDAIDGMVASYHKELPHGMSFDNHVFGGGSEFRAIATTTTGVSLRIARTENQYGSQAYLNIPFAHIRIGAFGTRYSFRQSTGTGHRSNTVFSGEGSVGRVKLMTEHSRITGHGPSNDNRSGYYMGILRITDRFSVADQYSYTNRKLYFTPTTLNFMYPELRNHGVVGIFTLNPYAQLKVESHWKKGWAWDSNTPPVKSNTATSVTMNPIRTGSYLLVSIAASY